MITATREAALASDALSQIVGWARAHERVVAVLALAAPDAVSVWFVLRGDGDGATRRALYDVQVRAWERFPEEPLSFRVIDLNEYPNVSAETLLPSDGLRLYVAPGANV